MSKALRGYSLEDLRSAYAELGVRRGSTVLLKTDLRLLGAYIPVGRENALDAHFTALSDLIDLRKGTLVVTSATTSLCNTDKVFDPATTPGEMGLLAEYVRKQTGSVRSFHPFLSYTALGKDAAAICENVSRHGFGLETPKARLIDLDALFVSIGQPPRLTASVIHHAEMLMGVPYRYSKEFMHPVVRNGHVKVEPFYMFVWYRQCGNDHDGVQKIFDFFLAEGGLAPSRQVGRGRICSMSLRSYFQSNVRALKQDIFMFLKNEPAEKPYRN